MSKTTEQLRQEIADLESELEAAEEAEEEEAVTWTLNVEEWSFKKTILLDDEGSVVTEEDGEAWSQRVISSEEVEEGYEL